MPAGNAVAALALQRLALLTGRPDYQRRAVDTLRLGRAFMEQHPSAVAGMLIALDFYLSRPPEIAIAGPANALDTQALLDVVYGHYLPNKVLALQPPEAGAEIAELIPLLEGKTMLEGRATAYVCQNYTCQQPVTTPEELAEQLAALRPVAQKETQTR